MFGVTPKYLIRSPTWMDTGAPGPARPELVLGPTGSVAPVRVGVLVSGTGTILDSILTAGIPVQVVVADRPCGGLAIASEAGIATELVARDRFDGAFDRDAYSARLAAVLTQRGVDLVAMAGFGTILTQPMHDAFGGRILNTHPALLPSFKGWHAVSDALAYGVKVTGCTVHVAGIDVDTGPILAQEAVAVSPGDNEESLQERIKEVERRLYPAVLRRIVDEGRILP
ncbi:MAG: phosphoribosylglycinamide formyltransferase, formyltetrahydrofolate-dependent [Acidimicrobiales bacterium]|nr:phosphoribosylglycinamide formyltransferase, formyltetrahydrofolate-dependent [Acidimicrobiales bacterium]